MIARKPLPRSPRFKRLRVRKRMTLVAAFRCWNGGVLLCADREESDDYLKSDVNKICRIKLGSCSIFIAGAGTTSLIKKTETQIHSDLLNTIFEGQDVVSQHQSLIETSLRTIYERYADAFREYAELGLVIVIIPYSEESVPFIYYSERAMLIPESNYVARGTGQAISDYLSSHLYAYPGMTKQQLITLAAFIFREANRSASGVGPNVDMRFVWSVDEGMLELGPDAVTEIQNGIPSLSDSLRSYWHEHSKLPDWLTKSELLNS